jgi:hypothetical protein
MKGVTWLGWALRDSISRRILAKMSSVSSYWADLRLAEKDAATVLKVGLTIILECLSILI